MLWEDAQQGDLVYRHNNHRRRNMGKLNTTGNSPARVTVISKNSPRNVEIIGVRLLQVSRFD